MSEPISGLLDEPHRAQSKGLDKCIKAAIRITMQPELKEISPGLFEVTNMDPEHVHIGMLPSLGPGAMWCPDISAQNGPDGSPRWYIMRFRIVARQ